MTDSRIKNLLLEIAGCFISALGTYSFAVAARVPVTGVAGIGAILYHLFGLPIGVTNLILNIPIILICYQALGRDFFLRSLRCMLLFAFFTDFVLPFLPVYEGDRMLATICGGVIGGFVRCGFLPRHESQHIPVRVCGYSRQSGTPVPSGRFL